MAKELPGAMNGNASTMRLSPILILVLLAVAGLGLGLRSMFRAAADQPTSAPAAVAVADWPSSIAGVPQGHVYTGITEEPEDVNPYTASGGVARRYVLGFTHEALLDRDPATGELRGALASAFDRATDGMACAFTLRDGVRFADGTPLTMADVMFGWELAQAGHLPLGFVGDAYRRVAAVEVLDDRRFRVTFRDAHYAAVEAVGESWLVGKRQFFVDRVAVQAQLAGVPAPAIGSVEFARLLGQIRTECGPGTGPYVLDNPPDGSGTWRRRQDLQLVRNVHCWRRTATPGSWNLGGVRLLFRDPTAAVTALLRHEVDWFSSPAVEEIAAANPELRESYTKLSYDYRTLGVFRIVWNCRRTPFDLPEVRRALGMLFDLDAIVDVFHGNGTKAKAFAKPDSPDYPHELEALPFDPAEARRQLRDAGFDPEQGKPLRIKLIAPQGLDAMRRTLELLHDAARRAGVDLQYRMLEWIPFVQEKDGLEWDAMFVQQTFRAWADPYEFVHTGAADNKGAWSDPEADRLCKAVRGEYDPARRSALLHDLHVHIYREQPTTFVLHPRVAVLCNVHVEGLATGPQGLVLERAFVAPQFQRQ